MKPANIGPENKWFRDNREELTAAIEASKYDRRISRRTDQTHAEVEVAVLGNDEVDVVIWGRETKQVSTITTRKYINNTTTLQISDSRRSLC